MAAGSKTGKLSGLSEKSSVLPAYNKLKSNPKIRDESARVVQSYVKASRLSLPNLLEFQRWCEVGVAIACVQENIRWWIGDWFLFGRERGFEGSQGKGRSLYDIATEVTGLSYQSLYN